MRILGIQLDASCLRAAVIEQDRNKVKLVTLKSSSINDSQNVKELYIPSFSGRIASAVSAGKAIIRPLELNIPKSRHFEEVLTFQTESVSHFKPEDVIAVPEILGQKGPKTQVILHIVPREEIRNLLLDLEKLNLDPDCISSVPVAVFHYACWKNPELQDALLIHVGDKEWVCSLVEKGVLKKSHAIMGGNEGLLSALWEDRKKVLLHKEVEGVAKQIDLLQLKSHLNPHLSERLNEMRQELSKVIFSFYREGGAKPYFFTGCIDTFGHYSEFLVAGFQDAVSSEIAGDVLADELKFAVPIGLGIEQTKKKPLQLRREEFFPKKNWSQSGLYALILMFTALAASVFLVVLGQKQFSARKEAMIAKLCASLEKDDPELGQKLFSEKQEEILQKWIQAVDLYSKDYPYIPKAPKVSEVLSWISSHPLLEKLKSENTPIIIRDLRYQLVQYPHIGALEDPYRAKVEIEFETSSPMSARKFHQALLKGDARIDTKQEIGWEALQNGYRASFFLKNWNSYVP